PGSATRREESGDKSWDLTPGGGEAGGPGGGGPPGGQAPGLGDEEERQGLASVEPAGLRAPMQSGGGASPSPPQPPPANPALVNAWRSSWAQRASGPSCWMNKEYGKLIKTPRMDNVVLRRPFYLADEGILCLMATTSSCPHLRTTQRSCGT
ncbi:hypothetical protein H1C71_023107, partial [Ictidomys tridecemlineatus]